MDGREQTTATKAPFFKRELSLGDLASKLDLSFLRRDRDAGAVELKPALRGQADGSGPSRSKKKKVVGLKIGGSQIAAATIVNNGKRELMQIAREPLERGVVVAGELRDPDTLSRSLDDFFRRHKLPRRGVRLGIASNRIGVRTFELAGIHDPKQLTNAIRFRAQETLPIPLEESVLDYHVLDERVDPEAGPTRQILLVVAYRELVDRYVLACQNAGIQLAGVDLEAFALLRALGKARSDERSSAVVVVSIGHDRTTFAVSDGQVCQFTRVLEWGGFQLDVALGRALDVSPSQAEPIKCALSLKPGAEAPEGLSPEAAIIARQTVYTEVEAFARELVSSLQFYQAQPGSLGLGEIILTGGTALLGGLTAELQRLTGVPVRLGDPLEDVTVDSRLTEVGRLASLSGAVGLAIED